MRALIQRVSRASVEVDGAVVGEIGRGLLALVGVTHDDDADKATRLAQKVLTLRIFADEDGVMNRSAADTDGAVLVVSQFTLYGDTSGGRRPSWIAAAPPEVAEPLVERFAETLREAGATVAEGRFGAHMDVALVNDGPVTLLLEL